MMNILLERRRLLIAKEPSYTPVNHLVCNGTQWIDAEYKPNNTTKVVAKWNTSINGSWVYGVIETNNNFTFVQFKPTGTGTSGYKRFDNVYLNNAEEINTDYVSVQDLSGLIINFGDIIPYVGQYSNFQSSGNLYLMYVNVVDGTTSTPPLSGRFYYCKIYENGMLIRDMIPCLDSVGKACMYDKVERKFYYSLPGTNFDYA